MRARHLLLGQIVRQVQCGNRDHPQAGQAGIGIVHKILARDVKLLFRRQLRQYPVAHGAIVGEIDLPDVRNRRLERCGRGKTPRLDFEIAPASIDFPLGLRQGLPQCRGGYAIVNHRGLHEAAVTAGVQEHTPGSVVDFHHMVDGRIGAGYVLAQKRGLDGKLA